MRVVLDTNILIGALITKGTPPDELYKAWLRGEFDLIVSHFQFAELEAVLARPRLRKFVHANEANIMIEELRSLAVITETGQSENLSPDPDDDRILASAIAAQADLIVSGDKRDMLALAEVRGIPILTARQALDLIGQGNLP